MSKLIRDLGEGKLYTLAVSTSSAGVELIAHPGDVPRDRVPLETVALAVDDALDLAAALEEAASFKRDVPVTGLNALRDAALKIAVEHGFTDATIGEDVALFHSEASELLEDHRAGEAPTKVWYEEKIKVDDPRLMLALRETGTLVLRHSSMMSDVVIDTNPPHRAGPFKPCGIPSECADLLIRVLHFCGKHGIDIEKAVREKMAYNASRPHRHGGKTL